MDFIVGFPGTIRQNDSIWIIMDGLTKSTHFIFVKSCYSAVEYAKVYLDKIVSLQCIPLSIIFDRGS